MARAAGPQEAAMRLLVAEALQGKAKSVNKAFEPKEIQTLLVAIEAAKRE